MKGSRVITHILLAAGFALWTANPAASADEDCLTILEYAVGLIEKGQYEQAAEPLGRLSTLDANDPLLQCTTGAALLHTGYLDAAREAFVRALEVEPGLGIGSYGVGVADLARRKYSDALTWLRRAAEHSPAGWADGAIAYSEALGSQFRSLDALPASGDPLAVETRAFVKYRKGLLAQARADLRTLTAEAPAFGAAELPGARASFIESKPVSFTTAGKGVASLAKRASERSPRVAGTLLLKADTSRVRGPAYVVFHIDGAATAIVNREPFDFYWDTRTVVNGTHTVKIVSHDASGAAFAQKEQRVVVANAGAVPPNRETSDRRDALTERLRRIVALKPSYWTASYVSGRAALAAGERGDAAGFFERCVALDPDRADAGGLLRSAYTSAGVFIKVESVPTEETLVAMTFDDGPTSEITPKLLDTLKETGAKATFFVVGAKAVEQPDLLRRMVAEGHEVGNHTYSHRNLELLPRSEVDREIMRAAVVFRTICSRRGDYFRPPGGHLGKHARQALTDYGMTCVTWTFNCGTFEKASTVKYAEQVVGAARPGVILLMHNGEEVTSQALPAIIATLKERGYRFVTLTELLHAAKKVNGTGRSLTATNRNKSGTS